MKVFWHKIIIMTTLVVSSVLLVSAILFIFHVERNSYMAAYIDKKELLKSKNPPRIILVGGSNLAFGIDSKKIEDELGYTTINMGLHAGLGLRFMLEDIKKNIKKSDLVVISPEYELFGDGLDGDTNLSDFMVSNPRAFFSLTSWHQFRNIFFNLREVVIRELRFGMNSVFGRQIDCRSPVYCRSYFNKNGDLTSHVAMDSDIFAVNENLLFEEPNEEAIIFLDEFTNYAHKQGVEVLFSFPPLVRERFDINKKEVYSIYTNLQKIPLLKIIDSPETHMYSVDLFFNSAYHLNSEGRKKRTEQLIIDIENSDLWKDIYAT